MTISLIKMMTLRIVLSHYGDQETGHNEFPYCFSLSSGSSGGRYVAIRRQKSVRSLGRRTNVATQRHDVHGLLETECSLLSRPHWSETGARSHVVPLTNRLLP